MKLLLGTTNPGKIADYTKYLQDMRLEIVTLKDLGLIVEEPLEIGETYKDNALLKARFYAERTEYPTLADDGGFEAEALDGWPGLESKRWVGPHGTDQDRVNKLMEMMKGEKNRGAKLILTVCVYLPAAREAIFVENAIEGIIPEKPGAKMVEGFPYRSVLFLPQYNKFYIDLSGEEHEEINHRRQACKELLLKLEPYLN
ncbi:MAG: hypothetical protein A3C85_01230 [Candidatus Doudnabacteria bacterium RIFCSPHIGHO2_02_FULL_48_21]|uniref:Non-canonical purine NTP pyrophosphatase n=1 Tax=Candidatus Doudnabacteria bacterium RIFCSPLOWO2_02_FULL_48_13 TaxID=1817845 RepID=A0A1F5Q9A2_9BACT|nr:MAG: hypothetical protein A3K05_04275 [Candidatus Doudnabacteria bacterium RIFCSPHIGHO2_01_48_18]OGE79580.1 MAG: hypothetical protein A2668_03285 [Candidatus Doudnabacteria bacterium RIFCSPHIGHO2_01_FULL_48_180]OGE91107.1 MAG: hypothetical protein A3F44_02170 [Candidatus Doudnabacteria bacterium RIFCSPHIGHO2_12_FULL_47_25]OGE93797.1 MAG: hypothetical protein A3C85_01230 [Candidatus Doudnabacteria bacterium RIFCSPHIGHO2_02_FULL_48_21]OGE97983.1 MAG: hypothetical protein A3A83_00815 [Candidatu